jgi:hypothetical protein
MKNNTTEARANIEDDLKDWVGSATKEDIQEKFGSPEWCKQGVTGEETCRFRVENGTVWKGSKKFRKSYTAYDEVMATFGANDALKSYKVKSQR